MLYLCQSRLCPTCGRVHNLKLIIIMTINRGYLKVPRALFYAEEWQSKRRFSRFEAVVSLLEQASYVDGRQMQLTGGTVRLRRGQFVTTVRSLAEQWGWKKDSTARFLNTMVRRGLIRVETVTVKGATDNEADDAPCCATIRATTATCITICNNDADEGDGDGRATACGTQSATTNATACETNIYNEENKELQECGKAGVKECVKGEKGLAHTHPTNNSEGVIGGETFACNDADEQKDATKNGRRVFTSEEWAKFSPAKQLVEWIAYYFPDLASMQSPLTLTQAEWILRDYMPSDIKYLLDRMQSKEVFRHNTRFYSTFIAFARCDRKIRPRNRQSR